VIEHLGFCPAKGVTINAIFHVILFLNNQRHIVYQIAEVHMMMRDYELSSSICSRLDNSDWGGQKEWQQKTKGCQNNPRVCSGMGGFNNGKTLPN